MKTENMSPAEAAFCRDIPEDDQEDVLTLMTEAAHIDDHGHAAVTILDRDHYDAINVHAQGIIEWRGKEYSFHVESGNVNGTVVREWEGTGEEYEVHQPTVWALQPMRHLVDEAILSRRGPFLALKWDAILERVGVAQIPQKYAYDRRFQPGSMTDQYWREKARDHQFEIVPEDVAQATRKRLMDATTAAGQDQ